MTLNALERWLEWKIKGTVWFYFKCGWGIVFFFFFFRKMDKTQKGDN